MKNLAMILVLAVLLILQACNETGRKEKLVKNKRHLNIPDNGIESMMEANTSKIIEGTQGSIVIGIGEVTRKKADITIRRNDRILDEKLIEEKGRLPFEYEGNTYVVTLKSIKKPLIGAGKAEITVTLQ